LKGGLIMAKHKHSEIIKAWADGAEIEWFNNLTRKWELITYQYPSWDENYSYRVKHQPVVAKYFYLVKSEIDISPIGCTENIDLEHWDLKLTFTDRKLTHAEVA